MFGEGFTQVRPVASNHIARFQPSELMKIALPLMLAWYFQKFEGRIGWIDFVLAVVLVELLIEVDEVDEVVLVVAAVLLVVELDDVLVVVVDTVVVVEQPGTGACWQPLAGSQVSVVQTFPSSQLTGPPTHRSAKQASAVVQALPSSHGVPSATKVCVQTPA